MEVRMKDIKLQLALAGVCIVLSFFMTLQFRTIKTNIVSMSESRTRELMHQIEVLKDEKATLMKTRSVYEKNVWECENSSLYKSAQEQMLKKEAADYGALAGLEDIEGPGLVINLDDSSLKKDQFSLLKEPGVFLAIMNELYGSGAEAVAINGQRVTFTTGIVPVEGKIKVNNIILKEPYCIQAIGDAKMMESALCISDGIADEITSYGIKITINKAQLIKMKKYNGTLKRQFMKSSREQKR